MNAGHSFRRTSATILANSGADIETILRHGGWRNEKCAKGYIEDALHYKERTGNMITSSILGPISSNNVFIPPTDTTNLPSTINGISTSENPTGGITSSILGPPSSNSEVIPPIVAPNLPSTIISTSENATDIRAPKRKHSSSVGNGNSSVTSHRNAGSMSIDDDFPDLGIEETELIGIIDRASQLAAKRSASDNNTESFSSTYSHVETSASEVNEGSDQTVLTQHVSTKCTKAILPDAFKLFNFENMNNCTFQFYVKK